MKPFSKNLFSQTPVAFGWLPKETINLDISVCMCAYVCVCVYMCVGKHVCAQPEYEWEIAVALFYRNQKRVWAKADQLEKVCTCRQTCSKCSASAKLPKLSAPKTQHPLITRCPSFLSSFYTFTPTRSPNATPKHPSMSTPPIPPSPAAPPIQPKFRPVQAQGLAAHTHTHTRRLTQLSLVGDHIDSLCPAEPEL